MALDKLKNSKAAGSLGPEMLKVGRKCEGCGYAYRSCERSVEGEVCASGVGGCNSYMQKSVLPL